MTGTISLENLLHALSGMSLGNRRWLADHLVQPWERADAVMNNDSQRLDAALARFHQDWGGTGSAMDVAEDLRKGRADNRTVDVWE